MREAGMEPVEPYPGRARDPWMCRCNTCGTIGSPRLDDIRQGHGGCRPCGQARTAAARRLPADQAIAEMRAAGLEPMEPYVNVGSPWRCQCIVCSATGSPTLGSIRAGQGGCLRCGQLKSIAARRIPMATAIEELREAGMEPLEVFAGSDVPWMARCNVCGAVGRLRLSSIRQGQGGCGPCSYRRRGERSRVPEQEARKIMRERGFRPLDPYPGRNRARWRSQCLDPDCGQVSFPTLTNVRNGSGCRYCCNHGLDWGAPAIMYVATHDGHGAHKAGITGIGTDRLPGYRRLGWRVAYESTAFPTGADAYSVEQAVFTRLVADFGASMPFLTKTHLPQNGYKETFSASVISVEKLIDLITVERARVYGRGVRDTEMIW
jgi:hypothetical protein